MVSGRWLHNNVNVLNASEMYTKLATAAHFMLYVLHYRFFHRTNEVGTIRGLPYYGTGTANLLSEAPLALFDLYCCSGIY